MAWCSHKSKIRTLSVRVSYFIFSVSSLSLSLSPPPLSLPPLSLFFYIIFYLFIDICNGQIEGQTERDRGQKERANERKNEADRQQQIVWHIWSEWSTAPPSRLQQQYGQSDHYKIGTVLMTIRENQLDKKHLVP